ncbi:MAG: geranylgeranylglyceryl/heptaprenylglyceryl phosphate synthase [Flavobacteriaceae bacterium]|nr:geranylgeranylglyceryl/heptaprenylglyceryl phosphate synthase [Flavobacteriaceae bacterium]
MNTIYTKILSSKKKGKKLLAVLLDPEKLDLSKLSETIKKINEKSVDFIFVGGSTVKNGITDNVVQKIKLLTTIPIVLFPGDYSQITNKAEAILFLSLLSGRNPEYLIEQQIKSVPLIQNSELEVIPTGYILIDGGIETAVQRVSQTKPISQYKLDAITNTAYAGMLMGNKLIYLEAGSGAKYPVSKEIINSVNQKINIPLIVGGGIKTKKQLETAYQNGADLVVIGNGFEENSSLLFQL